MGWAKSLLLVWPTPYCQSCTVLLFSSSSELGCHMAANTLSIVHTLTLWLLMLELYICRRNRSCCSYTAVYYQPTLRASLIWKRLMGSIFCSTFLRAATAITSDSTTDLDKVQMEDNATVEVSKWLIQNSSNFMIIYVCEQRFNTMAFTTQHSSSCLYLSELCDGGIVSLVMNPWLYEWGKSPAGPKDCHVEWQVRHTEITVFRKC